jgi:hypothetical protein
MVRGAAAQKRTLQGATALEALAQGAVRETTPKAVLEVTAQEVAVLEAGLIVEPFSLKV